MNGIFDSNVAGTPAVSATGTNGADGVDATSDTGNGVSGLQQSPQGNFENAGVFGSSLALNSNGVIGEANNGPDAYGVWGRSITSDPTVTTGFGVFGDSTNGTGISGTSTDGTGVVAQSTNLLGLHAVGGGATFTPPTAPAAIFAEGGPNTGISAFNNSTNPAATTIEGNNFGVGPAITGNSTNGTGVVATSTSGIGLHAVGGGANPATPPPITQAAIFAEGGPNLGIYATSDSNDGVLGSSNSSFGVSGLSNSGAGVQGLSSSGAGVQGIGPNGTAMRAHSGDSNSHTSIAIGRTADEGRIGVAAAAGQFANDAVAGDIILRTETPSQHLLLGNGTGDSTIAIFNGDVGIGKNNPQVKLDVVGDIHATGTKNFVQAHPTDPTKEIVYATLEGGEAGTYTRGTWKLDNGKAVIKLPEHFGLVTSEDGLTVQFTPRGEWLQLYVVQVNTRELVVRETQGKSGQFDYLIQGVRKGYEHHEVIQERK